ncbi:MAG: response regulator [Alphaproteobacteria bacterium]|nr:response regulator [Alphaproteobacteria bacterium]
MTEPGPASATVLFVDDEKNVLSAMQRQLRRDFSMAFANSGDEAVKLLETNRNLAVVVCDMRMPGMDGVATLAEFEKRSPDTVRIMLTGNADQETAIAAINRGRIFRFLNKPCAEDVLRTAIGDALRQHELVTAEKSLLNQTLTGGVKMLVEVLSLVAPEAFSRATRARAWVRPLAQRLGITNRWEIEVATMLAPIGLIAVPTEVVEKARTSNSTLSAAEAAMIARAPDTGRKLISHIPRLTNVAEFVYLQDRGFGGRGFPDDGPKLDAIPMGARVVKLLKDLAEASTGDTPPPAAVGKLVQNAGDYDPSILDIAKQLWGNVAAPTAEEKPATIRKSVPLDGLLPNDLILSAIRFKSGKLLLSEGIRVSVAQIERLRNLRGLEPITELIEIERATSPQAA